jgi:non-canonical poly(A) RNA polymerase PAPD5/7
VQVISKAKVPIIKYIDEATGLHVDISFENKSGLVANKTFKDWREQYPCLPILLTLLKHFLAMRDLNEVYQGGIGSFTLTCLLVSLLQQLPSVASGQLDPSQNLGIILLEFLDLYGNRFNTSRVGIRVDDSRPSYFPREELHVMPMRPKLQDEILLVIQDPNNADNNISRSSYLIKTVFACFAEAYTALTKQMATLDKMDFKARKGRSLLGLIIGGNYTKIEEQRKLLRKIYVDRVGKEEDLVDPIYVPAVPPLPDGPPPPLPSPPPPPPPAPEQEAANRDKAVGQLQVMDIDSDGDGFEDVLEMIKKRHPNAHARGGGANGNRNGTGKRHNPITLD